MRTKKMFYKDRIIALDFYLTKYYNKQMKPLNIMCIRRRFLFAFVCSLFACLNYPSDYVFSSAPDSNSTPYFLPDFPSSQKHKQDTNPFIKILETNPDSAQSTAITLFNQNPTNELSAYFASTFFQYNIFHHAVYWTEILYSQIPDSSVYQTLLIILQQAGLQCAKSNQWIKAAQYYERAAYHQPTTPEFYSAAALAWLNAGENTNALACLERGFAIVPTHTKIRSMLKQIYFHQKAYSKFETLLKKHLIQHPEDIAAQIDLAYTLIAEGRVQESLKRLEKLRDQYPYCPPLFNTLANLYHQTMRFESERKLYHDWLNYDQSNDSLYLKMAQSYEIENKWKSARQCYQKYIQKHSDDIDILFKLAETYKQESYPDSSLLTFQKILKQSKFNTLALKQAGQTAESLNRLDAALEFYQRWEKAAEKSLDPLMAQARVLEKLGQNKIAFHKYLQAEQLGGNTLSAYGLFKFYLKEQNSIKTKEYFKKGFIRSIHETAESEKRLHGQFIHQYASEEQNTSQLSNDSFHLEGLRKTMNEMFRYGLAHYPAILEETLNSSLKEYPHSPLLTEFSGDFYIANADFLKAVAYYEKTLEYKPREMRNQIKLVQALERSGDYDKAFRLCRATVEQNPDHVTSIRLCIDIAEKTGNLAILANRWEQLCKNHSDYSILKRHLIAVWNKLGRNDKVIMLLDEQS